MCSSPLQYNPHQFMVTCSIQHFQGQRCGCRPTRSALILFLREVTTLRIPEDGGKRGGGVYIGRPTRIQPGLLNMPETWRDSPGPYLIDAVVGRGRNQHRCGEVQKQADCRGDKWTGRKGRQCHGDKQQHEVSALISAVITGSPQQHKQPPHVHTHTSDAHAAGTGGRTGGRMAEVQPPLLPQERWTESDVFWEPFGALIQIMTQGPEAP